MSKKLFALLMTVCLMLSLATTALAVNYDDTEDHWAEDAINRWSGHDIIEGYEGNFDPDGTLTRAQMATIICRLLKLPAAENFGFNDVNEDDWFATYINSCAAAGIMLGYDGNAAPNEPISREEAFVMISRALGIKPTDECDKEFSDGHKTSDWAEPYINALVNADIVSGVGDGTLAPEADINRASMMSLLDKGISVYADEEGETVTVEEGATGIVLVAAPNVTVTGEAGNVAVVEGAAGGTTTLDNATVGTVTVTAENSEVVLGGTTTAENVDVTEKASGASVTVSEGAQADSVSSAAPESSVKVEGTVNNVIVSDTASNTTVETGKDATVGSVDTSAEGTTVSGDGTVENVTTSGNNTTVETGGTKVEAAEGTTGTVAGGETVEGGSSTTTEEKKEEEEPVTPTPPPHSHRYTKSYTSTEAGKHEAECSCGAKTTQDCTYENGTCSKCGYVAGSEAKIGTTYYPALEDALVAAEAGNDVILLTDVSASAIVVIDKAITLDGNNKTLTSTAGRAINVSGANGVTIKNLTVECTGERGINVIQGATNVLIDNVTVVAANYAVNAASSAANTIITVKDSDLTGLNVVNIGAAGAQVTVTNTKLTCNDQNANENYSALALNKDASGGSITFTSGVNGVFVLEGDSVKATNGATDGTITIDGSSEGVDIDVAIIDYGNNYYGFTTLDEAIAKAEAGETVKLIRDVTVDAPEIVTVPANVTLDLNGHTLLVQSGTNVVVNGTVSVGGTVTMQAGTTLKAPEGLNVVGADANVAVTYADGTYTAVEAVAKIGNVGYATLQDAINAAEARNTVTLLKNITVAEEIVIDKDIILDGSNKTITSTIDLANDGTKNVILTTGCTIQNMTINGGHRGIRADKLTRDLVINNVTIPNSVRPIHVHDAALGDNDKRELTVTVSNSTFAGKPSIDEDVLSASFTKCTFNVNNGCTLKKNIIDIRTDYTFTNCTFADGFQLNFGDLAGLQPEGYSNAIATLKETDPNSGTTSTIIYTKDSGLITFPNVGEAKIGDVYYETLEDAIAVDGNKTIVLFEDVNLDEFVNAIGETIDLNGNTLTGNMLGSISANGGIYKTANGYAVFGPEDSGAAYETTTGIFTVSESDASADGTDITIVGGIVILGQDMCTMPGQTITIKAEAQFIVPAGKTLHVYSKIVNEGTFTIQGDVILYDEIDEGPLQTANPAAYGSGKEANSAIAPNGGSIFLDHVDATLAADAGLAVNTDISGKEVSYADGAYKVVDCEPEGSDPGGDA